MKIVRGIQIPKEEGARLNMAMKGRAFEKAPAEPAEVEGQGRELISVQVECPWCSKIQWIYYDPREYLWYACCFCEEAYLDPVCI